MVSSWRSPTVNWTIFGGGRFEELASHSRVRRVDNMVFVGGTTAVEVSGRLHEPGDTYAQTHFVLKRIKQALQDVDAGLTDVVRTRSYLADINAVSEFARAHGEVFAYINPVATAVEARLTVPGMAVEIEVEAIVMPDENS